jgi:hypothetical protein
MKIVRIIHGVERLYPIDGFINNSPINGIDITIREFSAKASFILPWSRLFIALSEPQPGQYRPVVQLKGHGGKNEHSVGLNKNSSTMLIIPPRVSTEYTKFFFLFVINLYLKFLDCLTSFQHTLQK